MEEDNSNTHKSIVIIQPDAMFAVKKHDKLDSVSQSVCTPLFINRLRPAI